MTEDTKELVKALIEGFSKVLSDKTDKFVTKDDLKNDLKALEQKLTDKFVTKNDLKALEERLKKDVNESIYRQTTIILEAIGKYENMTEKHERLYNRLKTGFEEEK